MSIKKFEDLQCWQKSRELNKLIYTLSNQGNFSKDFGLRDQIRRSSISVMSNIAEGFGRKTDKEFIQFLFIAFGSNTELQAQLYAALDLNYITQESFQKTYNMSTEISKMLSNFIKYLQNSLKK